MCFVQFVFFLFIFLTFYRPQHVRGNPELRALMELKFSLDPENRFLSSWTSDGDPCSGSFEGVACNEHRKVANISLQGKGLSGKVSPAVAELKCLSGLYLHYNNLSGEIPKEISRLTELIDLYLDVNTLSGAIPLEIGNMESLQVLQICCNQLTGNIPAEVGSLKKLSVLALQHNRLTGDIPLNLGNLGMLKRLDLGFNRLIGEIPATITRISQLEVLDVQNNSLYGVVPSALRRLNEGFQGENNPRLCGVGFSTVRVCTAFDTDNLKVNQFQPIAPDINNTAQKNIPESANIPRLSNQTHHSKLRMFPKILVVIGISVLTFLTTGVVILTLVWYRRRKQKIANKSDLSDDRLSTDQAKELYSKNASPLVSLEYSNGWDPLADGRYNFGFFQDNLSNFRFNIEEVESATQYFSEANLLGRSNFSAVYRGVLRDGSLVAVRSINVTSCKSEEAKFLKGLEFLTSLRHENVVRLRGFCCSRGRGEFFLVFDFASKGNLSNYLDVKDGSSQVLDWSKRVSIIVGIAKGIAYLHSSETNKPVMVHQNISVDKILIDQQFNPLISDSGLPRLLADDIVFSALKTSAAMGYLAPEYITTGRFTEKSDIYAFGIIILQVLSGMRQLSSSLRSAAETCRFEDLIDKNLKGKFNESEAAKLAKVAVSCAYESPNERPTTEVLIQELVPVPDNLLFVSEETAGKRKW